MNENNTRIQNLIIDLGGVLYAIDYAKIETGMARLQNPEASNPVRYSRSFQDELFSRYERGEITPETFWQAMQEKFDLQGTRADFEDVWNSMLIGLIPGRKELIQQLAGKYRLFLLSNTNEVHHDFLIPECRETFGYFEKCYFSFRMGMRKPTPEIFQTVLQEQQLNPEETLFIEDSFQHIETARSLQIHTLYVQHDQWPDELTQYLS